MEHFDGPRVPLRLKAHVAVNLHVVFLAVIVRLAYMSGVERIPSLGVLDRWHINCRRVWTANRFIYNFLDCRVMLLVPLMVYIDLIVNEDVQVLWFFGLDDHISESVRNLGVSVRCNTHIQRVILRDRNRYKVFLDNLGEPNCDGKVVIADSGPNLVFDKLAFE